MWLLRTCISPTNFTMTSFILYFTLIAHVYCLRLPVTPTITTTANNIYYKCPDYWLGDGEICYFITDYLASWQTAREFCLSMESDLVIINNASTEENLMIYASQPTNIKNVWLGLNDLRSPGMYEWVDGTKLTFTNWLNDTYNADGNCVMLNVENQRWESQNCSNQSGFVCYKYGPFNESFDDPECEIGMKKYGNSCYWIVPGENNWQSGENWCETENGTLTTISSSLENIFIYGFVRQQAGAYWIGLQVDDSGLKWEADEHKTYTNWDGEPAITPGVCAVMERNGKWIMQPCDAKQISSAICERLITHKNVLTTYRSDEKSCPPMWTNIDNNCYLVVTVPTTWDGAHNQCLSLGGDLVSFKSQQDEMRVLNLVTSTDDSSVFNFWLGLRLNNATNERDLTWNSRSNLSYSNWESPLNFTQTAEGDFCAIFEVITSHWTIEPCSLTAIFVCEAELGRWNSSCDDFLCPPPVTPSTTSTTTLTKTTPDPVSTLDTDDLYPKSDPCPPDWLIFDNKCYLIKGEVTFERVNWTAASYLCRSNGEEYDLVSIHSALEHEFILSELKSRAMNRAWIGLNDKTTEGDFVWTDGSPVNFEDWAWQESFPSTRATFSKMTDDCVKIEMTPVAGKWIANDCNIQLGYICQKVTRSPFMITPPIPTLPTTLTISIETEDEIFTAQTTDSDLVIPIHSTQLMFTSFPADIDKDDSEAGDVTQQSPNTWDSQAASTLGISETNEIEETVSPLDIDSLVTAKCKCESSSRMTSGTIAGITLSCILAIALLVTATFHFYRRRIVTNVGPGKFSFDNALYNPHADHIQLDTNVMSSTN